ncbi:MAG: S-layer homology domain-containing protein [Defluviitaleaceae bacterium]|nr:S-layer homology domain-containing protein [Defluviitaleaceae bacterium]MCL2263306.1 S-layer homology domain-containing protein [Defluviitaleaceae bacterium]
MKKHFLTAFIVSIVAVLVLPLAVSARTHRIGDMGFHGGISEARHLPRTLETIMLEQGVTAGRGGRGRGQNIEMAYSEFVFIAGNPMLFEGIKTVSPGLPVPATAPVPDAGYTVGTFRVEHHVDALDETGEFFLGRTMIFDVQYRVEGTQVIYTYILDRNNWEEFIDTPDGTFFLDPVHSSFVISIIEDRTPAISFYRGDISARLVYDLVVDGDFISSTTIEKNGEFYGFSTAWSATETHITNVSIIAEDWALQYQIRPSVAVNKELQFVRNIPTQISFEGNFRELHQSVAGLRYDIFIRPNFMWDVPTTGTHSMVTDNIFEQLPAHDLSFLRGHPAEDDIHRLFAMQILQGDPRFFVPNQAITRGQFLTALARAIKLPVEEVTLPRARRGQQPAALTLFSDVTSDRPEFRYIQAIQRAGIAFGRADGKFYFDYPISRQEAIVTTIRALGLTNLGLNPTVISPFTDSNDIGYWAMRDVNVALMLDIIAPDTEGRFHPRRAMSKAEAAALFNHLLEYMRNGIVRHYSEQMVNITH